MEYQQPGQMRLFGVEEELLLVDARTFKPSPAAQFALAGQPLPGATSALELEVQLEQIEAVNAPCLSMNEVLAAIVQGRTLADTAARNVGARAVALATCPSAVTPHLVPTARYLAMKSGFGRTLREQLTCGFHVHVEVASAEEGVGILDRIRIWLPVLLALSANSPFWSGTDSEYASYRHQLWNRWPTSGPCEIFGSATAYRREVSRLLETGVPLDEGMIYFDARLSRNHPTVEVRIADVCLAPEHAATIATLVRALVETAAREWLAGRRPHPVPASQLRLANWKASKCGVEQDLVDPRTNRPRDAAVVLDELLEHVAPVLAETGEETAVAALVGRIISDGTGATAQRRAAAERRADALQPAGPAGGVLAAVVADAVERTHGLETGLCAPQGAARSGSMPRPLAR
jgi:carboxylate-amine ligase